MNISIRKRRLALTLLPLLLGAMPLAARAQTGNCAGLEDQLLHNGAIHTMDADDSVVAELRLINGRVVAAAEAPPLTDCTRRLDLGGRTVVPGLIDNHNHIVLLGLRPGHDTRLENARSIRDVLDTLAARAEQLPAGDWLTAIGGFDLSQFTPAPATPGFPTLAELDAAVPEHPVYLQLGFAGPGVTNSAGRRYFESQGITVGDNGELAGGQMPNPATEALFALRRLQNDEDRLRGTLDAIDYGLSLGLTTHLDQGGFPATGTSADGAANFDPYRAYDAVLQLHREGRLKARLRINFLHMESDPATPQLQARLDNAFPQFGDDMLSVLGIGELTAGASPIVFQATEEWLSGTRRVAEAGWRNENHSLTRDDYKTIIEGWEQVDRELGGEGIEPLQWVVAHVPFIDAEYTARLKALGGGVSVLGGWRYISGTSENNGPPFRMLLEQGIPMGMSSDGMQISPMNPWLGLYYVVTGRNARGELINAGQTLERGDALRLYTSANRWFLQEQDIGSLEAGKQADLVVLDRDYFDPQAVPDEALKDVRALLTMVAGRIVYGAPEDL